MSDTVAASPEVPSADLAAVVCALEEDIVLGRLHPRERLIEDELMRRFGLKRHAVRTVLAELALLGLVEHRKNIGSEVRAFSAREVADLYHLRELLETEAARLLPCPPPPDALQGLIAIQREHDVAVAQLDLRAVFRCNQRFHEALFACCENGVLRKAIHEYARQTHSIRFSSLADARYRERARQEHWAIIEALRDGRREDLIQLCRAHLAPSRDVYQEMNHRGYDRDAGGLAPG